MSFTGISAAPAPSRCGRSAGRRRKAASPSASRCWATTSSQGGRIPASCNASTREPGNRQATPTRTVARQRRCRVLHIGPSTESFVTRPLACDYDPRRSEDLDLSTAREISRSAGDRTANECRGRSSKRRAPFTIVRRAARSTDWDGDRQPTRTHAGVACRIVQAIVPEANHDRPSRAISRDRATVNDEAQRDTQAPRSGWRSAVDGGPWPFVTHRKSKLRVRRQPLENLFGGDIMLVLPKRSATERQRVAFEATEHQR